mmetsp:Transcript_5141/g.7617  ORF Transcript_5141/g.7617 Transcript_5141/m.7617 type:complete len:203 (+) Transcript_5141:78-686(+)
MASDKSINVHPIEANFEIVKPKRYVTDTDEYRMHIANKKPIIMDNGEYKYINNTIFPIYYFLSNKSQLQVKRHLIRRARLAKHKQQQDDISPLASAPPQEEEEGLISSFTDMANKSITTKSNESYQCAVSSASVALCATFLSFSYYFYKHRNLNRWYHLQNFLPLIFYPISMGVSATWFSCRFYQKQYANMNLYEKEESEAF